MTSYLVTIETDRARDKRTAPKKTSGADVLSSRKKNSEKPCTSEGCPSAGGGGGGGGGGCPSPPPPPPLRLVRPRVKTLRISRIPVDLIFKNAVKL